MSNVEILRPNTMPQSGGWMWNGCQWVPSGQCGQCGCGWDQCSCGWQCQPCPPGIRGPIIGVTDGSKAAPGEVGELIIGTANTAYPASSLNWNATLSPLVVPPGDWLLTSSMGFSTMIQGAYFYLSPLPPGISNNMSGQAYTANTTAAEFTLIGTVASLSVSVPTLLPFFVNLDTLTNAGTAYIQVEGRRMR